MTDHDDHAQMIQDCESRESKLTDWERTFIDSLTKQVADGRALTEAQSEKLNEIWDRVT